MKLKKLPLLIFSLDLLLVFVLIYIAVLGRNHGLVTGNNFPTPTHVVVSQTPNELVLTLVKGEEVMVPNTTLSLLLKDSVIPSKTCYDCGSMVKVQLKNQSSLQTLQYTCGSLAGCTLTQSAEGYRFTLDEQVNASTVRVKVTKE